MYKRNSILFFSVVGVIAILFGIFYGLFGLEGLPPYQKFVPSDVYSEWANGLYGAMFIGFGLLVFFVGRYAFQKNDKYLMKSLLYGINGWLIVEALYSLYYGVYFNIGVDIVLMMFLSYPLIKGIKNS